MGRNWTGHRGMIYAPLIAIALATLADILTTRAALRRGGTREANPLMLAAMRFGPAWIVVKLGITAPATALFYAAGHEQWLWPFVAVIAFVAWSNTRKG